MKSPALLGLPTIVLLGFATLLQADLAGPSEPSSVVAAKSNDAGSVLRAGGSSLDEADPAISEIFQAPPQAPSPPNPGPSSTPPLIGGQPGSPLPDQPPAFISQGPGSGQQFDPSVVANPEGVPLDAPGGPSPAVPVPAGLALCVVGLAVVARCRRFFA